MGEAMKFFDPPPVRYFGSKWQLADWIIESMPPHMSYVEPYCGGASVFFRKAPSGLEVLNDLNGDVVNFFDMLRDHTDELVRLIDLTPFSRQEYERGFEPVDEALERARRFYVRSWQAFGSGGIEKPTGWRHQLNKNRGTGVTSEWSRLSGLFKGARRLKDAQIECLDALDDFAQRFHVKASQIAPLGMALGSVELMEVFPTELLDKRLLSKQERSFGDFSKGRYAWMLCNPVMFAEPIPCTGHQRLREVV